MRSAINVLIFWAWKYTSAFVGNDRHGGGQPGNITACGDVDTALGYTSEGFAHLW